MATQTILWTVLPNGVEGNQLKLSVHIAPRLETDDAADTTLSEFDDFVNWPTTLAGLSFNAHFPAPVDATLPASLAGVLTPDPELWAALFPPITTVRSHQLPVFDDTIVHSYNVGHVVDFLQEQYSKIAVGSPDDYPLWADLAGDSALGPLGFSARGDGIEDGPTRKVRLTEAVAGELAVAKAIPYSAIPPQSADDIGKLFLQLEKFLKPRGKSLLGPFTGNPAFRPKHDFHDVLAFVLQHPGLLRMLGLVIDLVVDNPRPSGAPVTTKVQLLPPWPPIADPLPTARQDVAGFTHCRLGPRVFVAAPRNAQASDFERGHLRLGDQGRFTVVIVDPDGGSLKAMMLADNLQRARPNLDPGNKLSLASPDAYSVPSLRTAGFSVARSGIAPQFVVAMEAATALNASVAAFDPAAPQPTEPDYYLDDLIRGIRFDVHDGRPDAPGLGWRSLMARVGTYTFLNLTGPKHAIAFEDEGTVIAAPTSAVDGSSPDLYLQESLFRWDGWSLVASRPGQSITLTDGHEFVDNDATTEFALEIRAKVKPRSLSRLRFGRPYLFRGRTVDLAGNSVPFAQGAAAGDGPLVTPAEIFTRFEPVSAPPVLLRAPRVEGESPEVVVIRSENAGNKVTELTVDVSDRHVVPPRSSQLMAEHHGMFDQSVMGPMDVAAYSMIAGLDAGTLADPPAVAEPGGQPGTFVYPPIQLTLNYLPDVLARRALVRGLPASPATSATVRFEIDPSTGVKWPHYRPFRLTVVKGQPGWELLDRTLTVRLAKADVVDIRLSCGGLTDDDLELLGLWHWISHRLGVPPNQVPAALRDKVKTGRHWMFTPYRELKLVHAVRTPLTNPELPLLSVSKALGETFGTLRPTLTFHRKSTAKVDVVGTWAMPIDEGPGGPDPVTPRQFRAVAFTAAVDSRTGPDQMQLERRHEFGDTKYRLVTYQAIATSSFTEYFTEHAKGLPIGADTTQVPGATGLEEATVVVRDSTGSTRKTYRRGPDGDFTVEESTSRLKRVPGGELPPAGSLVDIDYVEPEIHATGQPSAEPVLNSARPAAPRVLYIIPTFGWTTTHDGLTSTRAGNGLRVYLERPWWSSGEGEKLAVVLWRPAPNQLDPEDRLSPLVTMWGFDPVFVSVPVAQLRPTFSSFPLRVTDHDATVSLAELPTYTVDVAAHNVGFDETRDLWFCDIEINHGASYNPFVRLALARYQRQSVPDAHLSPVVLADFIQLSPTRTASVVQLSGPPKRFAVTLTGRGYVAVNGQGGTAEAQVILERRIEEVADPNLGWEAIGSPLILKPTFASQNLVTWQGQVVVPPSTKGKLRLVLEESERLFTGRESPLIPGPGGRRPVHLDIISLP